MRSALVPGAGQRFMGQDRRGNFFLGATAILAAGALVAHDAFLEAHRDQAEAQQRFDRSEVEDQIRLARSELREAADDADNRNVIRWALVGATAGVYLWNVLDAFGLGNHMDVPNLAWSAAPSSDGVLVCATWSIR